MRIKFFAYLRDRDYAGCKEMELPVCADLKELGELLSERFGDRFRKYYFSSDGTGFGEEAIVLVNGRRAEFLNGIYTVLAEGDTIQLFPVVAGG